MKITIENFEKLFHKNLSTLDLTFELFFLWAQTVTVTERELQKVIANTQINKWFNSQLKTIQFDYEILNQNYKMEDQKVYARMVFKLFSIFPKALIEEAKKREEKPKTTTVSGLSIEFPISNLN